MREGDDGMNMQIYEGRSMNSYILMGARAETRPAAAAATAATAADGATQYFGGGAEGDVSGASSQFSRS